MIFPFKKKKPGQHAIQEFLQEQKELLPT